MNQGPMIFGSDTDCSRICNDVIDILGRAHDLPKEEMQQELHYAAKALVNLRDLLIELVRGDGTEKSSRWREPLDQINQAATLIVGVEYPSSGFNRDYMKEARTIVESVKKNMP